MFATLLGALPMPPSADAEGNAIEIAIRAQEAAGIEPITDGRLGDAELTAIGGAVAGWEHAQRLTDRAVKQALPGPWCRGGRDAFKLARAIRDLASAGCQLVEIEEVGLEGLSDAVERKRFEIAHGRLLDEVRRHGREIHLSLSLVGGAPPPDAIEAIASLSYASLAIDLIHGPDSWNLVTRWPGDRGVIAGVVSADGSSVVGPAGEPKEVLLWAANYAASTRGRSRARVGLGSAGSWANLTWDEAVARMNALGEAARLAAMPPSEAQVRELDPRAVSSRRAALGHDAPPPKSSGRGRGAGRRPVTDR